MPRRADALCLVVLVGLLATPVMVLGISETPYEAIVSQPDTPIRAGAGRSFYVVGQLAQGTQVTVEEVVFGWYKIRPPQGTFSYISRAFVDAYGDGRSGTINTNRAAVRTASINGPGESYRRQIDLLKGDTVQIVAEEGSFYKIIPPDGAYVFLPPGTIGNTASNPDTSSTTAVQFPSSQQPTLSAETAAPSPSNDQPIPSRQTTFDEAPAAKSDSNPPASREPSVTPAAARSGDGAQENTPLPPQDKAQPVSKALIAVEKQFEEAHGLPLEDQPLNELLKTYQAVGRLPNLEPTDRHIVKVRLAELRHRARVADALRQIATARENIQTDVIQEVLNDERLAPPKQPYDARGLLHASGVYNGNVLPQLFRVVEPASHRIISYVRLKPGVDPSTYVGKYVGIAGQKVFDSRLKLKLIEANHLEIIELTATR